MQLSYSSVKEVLISNHFVLGAGLSQVLMYLLSSEALHCYPEPQYDPIVSHDVSLVQSTNMLWLELPHVVQDSNQDGARRQQGPIFDHPNN